MQTHDTEMHECRTCTSVTEHVRRTRYGKPELYEGMQPKRWEVVVCLDCGTEREPPLVRREVGR